MKAAAKDDAAKAAETARSGSTRSEDSGGGGVHRLHTQEHAGEPVSGGGGGGGGAHSGVHHGQTVSGCGAASVAARQPWMGSVPPEYTTEFIKRAFAGARCGGGDGLSLDSGCQLDSSYPTSSDGGGVSLDSGRQLSTTRPISGGGGGGGGGCQPLAVVVRRNAFRQGGVSVVGPPSHRSQSPQAHEYKAPGSHPTPRCLDPKYFTLIPTQKIFDLKP